LLILDEPANGLDPAGVVEIRELLRTLAHEQGVTVFMSSHILTEVDRLATRIGIIHQGHLLEELDAEQMEQLRSRRLEIQVHDLPEAERVLARAGFEHRLRDHSIILNEQRAVDAPESIATLLVNAGTPPSRLAVEQEDLEAYFLRLTGARA
jgi:ABC-2 type transport system ATP-binding protein